MKAEEKRTANNGEGCEVNERESEVDSKPSEEDEEDGEGEDHLCSSVSVFNNLAASTKNINITLIFTPAYLNRGTPQKIRCCHSYY